MKKYLSMLLTLLLILGLFAGCGSAATPYAADRAVMVEAMPAEEMAAETPMAKNTSLSAGAEDTVTQAQAPENRKWIVTIHLSAETEDLDAMTKALDERIASFGGYVENQSVYNGSSYAEARYRSANLTIRIPAEKAESFVESVGTFSNIVSQEQSRQDITLTYVDTESRKKALETEQTRLLELLKEAETMADLLEIEARLTEVRYELESVASRLRTMDNQVDYATLYLNISEVREYTQVEEPSLWERITKGFGDSLKGVGEGIVDLFAWIVINSPYLVVYGAVIAVAIPLASRLSKWAKKRKEAQIARKAAEFAAKMAQKDQKET